MNESFFNISFIVISAVIGACVLLLMYIIRMLKNDNQTIDANTTLNAANNKRTNQQQHENLGVKTSATATAPAGRKQKTGGNQEPKWTQGRSSDKHNYAHPWLLTSLKGHTGQVFDMDFSSNGKYLASCAEEPDPGGPIEDTSIQSIQDCNKENTPTAPKGLSRRQRKNRRREDTSPPAETKKKSRTKALSAPLKQFTKLSLSELEVSAFLRSYLLSAEQMLALGYPVESELHPGRAIIFKSPMTAPTHYNPYKASRFDVNAREFIPQYQQYIDYNQIKKSWSSGSSDSSSGSLDSDDNDLSGGSSDQDSTVKSSGSAVRDFNSNSPQQCITSEERQCVRCGHGFFVASDGEYLTQEHCLYHWGKLQRGLYSCCNNSQGSVGCSVAKLHVWNGVGVGFNGPFDSYVRTRSRKTPPPDGNFGVYALDCEMCYTVGGLELAKITVIGADGRLVYDCFVKPEHEIVDYNTRFSGITARDLNKRAVTKTLRDVQNDLMGFVNADTVLVGHGLENDLRALRIMHGTVVDTAVTFPHYNGLPFRRSLKSLTQCYLKREIQNAGHNSCEDSRACMELMLWRIRKDFKPILEHLHLQQRHHNHNHNHNHNHQHHNHNHNHNHHNHK